MLVPTHNMARFLPDALRSIQAQTFGEFEALVIDDGSTDATPDAVAPFLADPRIRYHRQEKRGVAAARNEAIRRSLGEFVALLDADDLWAPEKLALQVEAMRADPDLGVVYTDVCMIDLEGQPLPTYREPRHDGWILDRLIASNFVTGSSSMIRRSALERAGPYDEGRRLGEDYELWLRLARICRFRFLPQVTYFYRQWPSQSSRNEHALVEAVFELRREFLRAHPDDVAPHAARLAISNSLVSRSGVAHRIGGDRRTALRHALHAIGLAPFRVRPWKALARIVLDRP